MRCLEEHGVGFDGRRAKCRSCRRQCSSTSAWATRNSPGRRHAGIGRADAPRRRRSRRATSAPASAHGRQARRAGPAMKGGIGTAAITLPNGLVVGAIVAVNAVGDVVDPRVEKSSRARARPDGRLARRSRRRCVRRGVKPPARAAPGENTTIAVVATNARCDQDAGAPRWRRWPTTASRAPSSQRTRRRRRHAVRAGDRHVDRARSHDGRRARRRSDRRSDRARGEKGDVDSRLPGRQRPLADCLAHRLPAASS